MDDSKKLEVLNDLTIAALHESITMFDTALEQRLEAFNIAEKNYKSCARPHKYDLEKDKKLIQSLITKIINENFGAIKEKIQNDRE